MLSGSLSVPSLAGYKTWVMYHALPQPSLLKQTRKTRSGDNLPIAIHISKYSGPVEIPKQNVRCPEIFPLDHHLSSNQSSHNLHSHRQAQACKYTDGPVSLDLCSIRPLCPVYSARTEHSTAYSSRGSSSGRQQTWDLCVSTKNIFINNTYVKWFL